MQQACLATASAETVASSVSLSISEISSASRFRSMIPPMKPLPGEASPELCSMLVADLPRVANPLATPPKKPFVGEASPSSVASNSTPTRGVSDGAPSGETGV